MKKLPRTLHIEGSRMPTGKVDPEAVEFNKLRGEFLVIEEKVDGTGVSISLDSHLDLQIYHRGSPAVGKEFRYLYEWANLHWEDLLFLLGERYILFGEWMHDKHSIFYDKLPDYFLESDIYDKNTDTWLSTSMRNKLLSTHRYIKQVPVLAALKPSTMEHVTCLVGKSNFQSDNWKSVLQNKCQMLGVDVNKTLSETDCSGLMEGLYIKQEDDSKVINRYKYVRYDFVQTIINSGTHLKDRFSISNDLLENYYINQ